MSLESLYLLFDESILLQIEELVLIVLTDEDGDKKLHNSFHLAS